MVIITMKTEVKLIKPMRYSDHRGFFAETYNRKFCSKVGIDTVFVQDNHSFSKGTGTLRGLHFQAPPYAQGKLVRCGRGAIFDVAVDIRKGSPNYGTWVSFNLTFENGHQLYIPPGFAHGFVTLEPNSEIVYKSTNYYAPDTEGAIRWNDPDLDIRWPVSDDLILSKKDSNAQLFNNFNSPFTYCEGL
jgi:dTDP-4-dehydrorhamnose 3,5-epimerase